MDIQNIARVLRWALGGYTFTTTGGTVADNLHEMFGENDAALPFFSSYIGKDAFEHVFTSCTLSQMQLSVSDGLAQCTLDIVSQKDEKDTIKALGDLTLFSGFPLSFVDTTVSIAASDASAKIRDFTLTIQNNADAAAGRGMNSRYPQRTVSGERVVTWSAGRFFDGTGELERFWGDADGVDAGGADEFIAEIVLDADTDGTVTLNMPKSYYTSVQQQPSGRAEMPQSTQARALSGTVTLDDASTEQSEILATIDSDATDLEA